MADQDSVKRINGFGDTGNIDIVELYKDLLDGHHALVIALDPAAEVSLPYDVDNPLFVKTTPVDCSDTNNSTETPLPADTGGSDHIFTGTSTATAGFSTIAVHVHSDVGSATDGLRVEFSSDEVEWFLGESYTLKAGAVKFFTPPVQAEYFRIVYINGVVAQTTFHLSVLLKLRAIKWSSHNIADPIVDEDDAQLVKSVITGKKASGAYDNVSLTNGGNMKVSLEEFEAGFLTDPLPVTDYEDYFLEVQRGNRTGKSVVHKFGGSASIVAALVPVANSNTYNTPTTPVALEFVSSSGNDSSGGSGARQITVQGIQSATTWEQSTQTYSTNGVTPVAIGSWLRIYRWFVSQSGTYASPTAGSHAGTLTIRVAGAGATWSTIPITPFPLAQSQIAVYTIAKGKTGFFRSADVYVDSGKTLQVLCFQRPNADTVAAPFSAMRLINHWVGVSGEMHYKPKYPNGPYVGPCDFGFMAQGTAVASDITVDFELEIVDT